MMPRCEVFRSLGTRNAGSSLIRKSRNGEQGAPLKRTAQWVRGPSRWRRMPLTTDVDIVRNDHPQAVK